MREASATATTAIVLALLCTASAVAADDKRPATDLVIEPRRESAEVRAALTAAIAQLPKAPVRIAVMDVTRARPGVREYLLTLDAFTLKGNDVIYVVQQSELLKGARTGAPVYSAMLAAVLWHEMAHLSGADERGARQAEEEFWTRLVRDGAIDRLTGLRYLEALKKRPDDQLLAAVISRERS